VGRRETKGDDPICGRAWGRALPSYISVRRPIDPAGPASIHGVVRLIGKPDANSSAFQATDGNDLPYHHAGTMEASAEKGVGKKKKLKKGLQTFPVVRMAGPVLAVSGAHRLEQHQRVVDETLLNGPTARNGPAAPTQAQREVAIR